MMDFCKDFDLAIFDLDGTLVDSIDVWRVADLKFMARRGITVPDDFYEAISHMNLLQASEYIVDSLGLPETPEQVECEFLGIIREEYAENIPMINGAGEFLKKLKAAGVKLAIATASQEELYCPCLERNGVYDLFDCFVTLADVNKPKGNPDIYLLAAERLGIEPERCVVFEDIYLGAVGAKLAGMACVGIREEHSRADWPRLEKTADLMISDFTEI